MADVLNLGKYLTELNKIYSKNDKQSLTETLNNFRQISEEYKDFNETKEEFSYSSYNFLECTKEE